MCITNGQAFLCVLWMKRAYHKYSLSHIILLASYISFLILSASAFFLIESANADNFRNNWHINLANERRTFITRDLLPEIFNNSRLLLYIHDEKSQFLASILNDKISAYEQSLKLKSPMPQLPCTFVNSLLFVFSTVTTIGYGYIYPVTNAGRILSIIISITGIPFTIVVIKDISYLLAKLMNYPCEWLSIVWAAFRFCTLRPVDEEQFEKRLQEQKPNDVDYRLQNADRLLGIPVTVAVLSLVGWTSVGSLLTHFYLPDMQTSTAFYFVFNSLTTIGVGDVEPGRKPAMIIVLFVYILIGLAFVSLFINLIHAKFSRAYWLPGRLYVKIGQDNGAVQTEKMASLESFEDFSLNDASMDHYTTLGILQVDDKCGILNVIRSGDAYIEAKMQTEVTIPHGYNPLPRSPSPTPVRLPIPHTSREDVNDLIIETYGTRTLKPNVHDK